MQSPTLQNDSVCPWAPSRSAKKARLNDADKQNLSTRLFNSVFEPINAPANNGFRTPDKQEGELDCPYAPKKNKGAREQYDLESVVRRFPM